MKMLEEFSSKKKNQVKKILEQKREIHVITYLYYWLKKYIDLGKILAIAEVYVYSTDFFSIVIMF